MNKEILPASHLNGLLRLPADKSISHRAAMFAALYQGRSTIHNFSSAADPHSTLRCLRDLGVSIEQKENEITVEGTGRDGFRSPDNPLNCGNSGTTMRLLSGIIGGAGISCTLTGDESLNARTMQRIIDPLRKMGINIEARDDDFAPLKIRRDHPLKPLHFPLPIASAQLKSCVLLAGLFGDEPTEVIETKTSRDHTERLLQLPVEEANGQKRIQSSTDCLIPEQSYTIPGDFSAAAFWLVAGAIHPAASVQLLGVGLNPTRTGALEILQQMGAAISVDNERMEGYEPVADMQVSTSALKPVHITAEMVPNCIDEISVLMIAMLFAEGVSTIHGAGELRHKETDRLHAMAQNLEAAGAHFEEFDDGFKIYGDPEFTPQNARFDSKNDHRIAMAAAVLALMAEDQSQVKGAACTAISYPSFWKHLAHLTN